MNRLGNSIRNASSVSTVILKEICITELNNVWQMKNKFWLPYKDFIWKNCFKEAKENIAIGSRSILIERMLSQ